MTAIIHVARATSAQPNTLTIAVSRTLQDIARLVAKARMQAHNGNRRPGADLGAVRNFQADYSGVLAELVVILKLEQNGLQPTDYVLFADAPPLGPDFVLDGIGYDIKSVPIYKQFLCVSEERSTDPLYSVDFILPVVFPSADRAAIYAPVPASLVASWPLRQGHSPYRSVSIATLQPICSLREVLL